MLVDGVHRDQRKLVVAGSDCGSGGSAGLLQNRNAGVGHGAAQAFAIEHSHSGLHALIAHHVGVLGHGGQDVTVLDQAEDRVGLVEAHADHVSIGSLDRIAGAVRGALVAAEDAHDALGDVVFRNGLGLGSVALAVLGLEQLKARALKSGAEAGFTCDGGGGGSIDVDDTDLAGGDALGRQLFQHGLSGGLAGGLVVGGEGGLSLNVGGRVDVDDLHAGGNRLIERRGDGVGAVGSHDDRLVARRDSVVHLLDLQRVVLGVGRHKGQVYAQLGGGLLRAFLKRNPVLVDGVHRDQRDFVAVRDGCRCGLGGSRRGRRGCFSAAGQQTHSQGQHQQNGKCLFHSCSSLMICLILYSRGFPRK